MENVEILGYIVGILGIVLGGVFWTRWNQAVKLLKELGEAFTKTATVLEDKNVTKEEALELLKEWEDVVVAFLTLLPKSALKYFIK